MRKKAGSRKKTSWFNKGVWLKALLALFSVFFLVTLGHFLYDFAVNWDHLNVTRIDVKGVKVLNGKYVKRLAGLSEGANIFSYSLPEDFINSEKWIKKASIKRDFPDRIILQIQERLPLAVYRDGAKEFVITADEFVIKSVPKVRKLYKIPEWRNYRKTGLRIRKDTMEFLKKFHTVENEYFQKLDTIILNGESLEFSAGGMKVYFGRPEISLLKNKLKSVKAIIADAAARNTKIEYMDMKPFTKKMRSAIIKFKEQD